jgi:pSer/pThr/pTyr-binding forkhead associated (FHA) protein
MAKIVFDYPFMEKEYNLDGKDRIEIGRGNNNDLQIPDYTLFKGIAPVTQRLFINDLTKVSRLHARLTFRKEEDRWYIEDVGTGGLGSNYGTFVNEVRLEVKKVYKLSDSDNIRFGPIKCTFSMGSTLDT